jgi:putative ABC transport system ATP-binding protein
MSASIEIKNLKFSYGSHAILDIDELHIKAGEVVFLYGPSGSGKSTLLELIAGVLKTQSGELKVGSKNLVELGVAELDLYRAENIGYIFQSFNLIPYLSVMENIQLPFLFQKNKSDSEEVKSLISDLGLAEHIHKPVSDLSVGQQQRVAVARALIKKPNIILADEPTSALDYNHREKFLKILFELCRKNKTTVLFVSHDLTIEKLFDRSISLVEHNKVKFAHTEVL